MFIEEWVYQQLLREEWERRLLYNPTPVLKIPFYTVRSEVFAKSEVELLAYSMPITKLLEDNSVKELQEFTDAQILRKLEEELLWGK